MFFTLLQDLQMMMHHSFPFPLPIHPPIFVFLSHSCESKPKLGLSIGQVLQYNPVPPMGCWTVRVDLREANCSWIHSSTAVSAPATHFSASSCLCSPALLVSAHLHWQCKQHSTFLLIGSFVPLAYQIHISFSPIRSKEMESLFIRYHTSLTCRYIYLPPCGHHFSLKLLLVFQMLPFHCFSL